MTSSPDRHASYGTRRSDPTKPSAARIYDYLLGGAYNYESDRVAADQLVTRFPLLRALARYNRTWVQRAVRYLVSEGVHQFLDIGSGIPTAGNVHEIVHATAPTARVVYVDYELVAVNLGRELLETNPYATSIHADMRLPGTILDNPLVEDLLDFSQPVAVIWGSVLHFLPDEDNPFGLVEQYKQKLVPGSYVALTHGSEDFLRDEPLAQFHQFVQLYNGSVDETITIRTVPEIERFFAGTRLVSPGLVPVPDWRPDTDQSELEPDSDNPARGVLVGGVGRVE